MSKTIASLRPFFPVLILVFTIPFGVRGAHAQNDGCDQSLANVYTALQRAQNAWAGENNAQALEALREAREALETIESACAQQATASVEAQDELCGVSKWEFIPTGLYTVPGPDGFKFILVRLAVQNNSSYWGRIAGPYYVENNFVTTEGGFQYSATRTLWADFSTAEGTGQYESYVLTKELVPPHFVVSGFSGIGGNQLQLIFKVAESQNHFAVTIPEVRAECLHPDGQKVLERSGPITVDLDNIPSVTYPTSLPDSDSIDISQPITIPDKGIVQIVDISRTSGQSGSETITFNFNFTNISAGYEVRSYVDPFLVGDDGIVIDANRGYRLSFYAGPGQSAESTAEFPVTAGVTNFKLIWINEDGSMAVYNVPEAAIQ